MLGGHADRAHAPGELLLADLHQSGPLHHLCQLGWLGKGRDALGEVLVRTSAITGNPCGRPRHQVFGVQGIEGSNDAVGRFAELEDQQSPPWCQNASEFTNGHGRVGDVANAKRDGDQIHAPVGQFYLHGIALTKLGHGVTGARPPLRRFFTGMDEHFFRKVHAQRAGWLGCREQQRQITGPTGHVEHAILRCDPSKCHHPPSPGLVLPG